MPRVFSLLFAVLAMTMGCRSSAPPATSDAVPDADLHARAQALAQEYLIVDGHIDVPYRMTRVEEDVTEATDGGDFDHPRAVAGGLNAPFMSIYIPAERQQTPGAAKALADSLIDLVEGFVARAPDKYAIATSPADVRQHFEAGLVSLPMGMENGAPVEGDLALVDYFYDRGIRYITLTHSRDNGLSDSSYDTTRTWNGLSPYGEDVVRAMNRVGMLVDISHLSDSAAFDVLRVTTAPVIASHSSVRQWTPGWERNMDDDLLRALADNGGVIMINFGSAFLKTEYQDESNVIQRRLVAYLRENGLERTSPEAYAYYTKLRNENPVGTVEDVADHIDYVAELVGVEHIGLGSDFDGVFALPAGLQDVSEYPNLIAELLRRGYSEDEIAGILGANVLRVWDEAERIAAASP